VVDAVVLNPVPGAAADRVVQIGEYMYLGRDTTPTRGGMSATVLEAMLGSSELFSEVAWSDNLALERKADDFTDSVAGFAVSPNFFSVFHVAPLLGRTFAPDEAVPRKIDTHLPAQDTVMVLSHDGWRSLFAGDPHVLGRTLELGGLRFTVIGVMPEWFQFPRRRLFWIPVQPEHLPPNRATVGNTQVIARLAPEASLAQAQALIDTVAQRLSTDASLNWRWKRTNVPSGLTLWVRSLRESLADETFNRGADDLRRTLFALLAAIGFILLISCANVANLMLARTERRRHELAIRAALGAGRARLFRQLLTESTLLAGLGGAAGVLLSGWGMKLLLALNTLPQLRPATLDGEVLGVALTLSLTTALGFGLVPAWRGARPRLSETLAQGGTATTVSKKGRRYRGGLVVVQVALTVVLLAGAGLMIESVARMLRVDPGYDPENLVGAIVAPPARMRQFNIPLASRNAFYEEVRDRLAAVPGVTAAGIWKNGSWSERISIDGRAEPLEVFRGSTGVEESDYFRVARVPLLAGRYLDRGDVGEKNGAVLINASMARLCWPGENAVGKNFRAADSRGVREAAVVCEVVGVVSDTRSYRYDEEARPTFFRPYQESSQTGAPIWVVVRTALDPKQLLPALRREIGTIEPNLASPSLFSVRQMLDDTTQPRRVYRNYLFIFAMTGLGLSALGIYGVLAYSVAQRTRELGIRLAIGASRRHVISLVMGEGAGLIGAGAGVGLLGTFWLTQFLRKQLFEVSPADPMVLATVTAVLAGVALLACWLPARRAAKVDPVVALRTE
jgi:predicted permease